MLDLLKKGVLVGIGLGLMTKEKVEELAKKTAEAAKLSEEEGRKLVEELLKRSDEERKSLQEQVEKGVKVVLEKMKIATREDLEHLEERLAKLESSTASKED